VARIYAGILGLLALLTSLAFGVYHREANNTILFSAWLSLLGFSAVGYVAGGIADWVVQESVQSSIAAELAAEEAPEGSGATPTA
jgi:hypothetical protein